MLDDIYGGETYDARIKVSEASTGPLLEPVGTVVHKDPSTAHAILSSQMMSPIQKMQLLSAQSIMTPHAGITVVDFGQNIAGWGRLTVKKCPRGQLIKMSFAEITHQTNHPNHKCNGTGNAEDAASRAEQCFPQLETDGNFVV